MSADKYLTIDQNAVYFLTFTVTDRIDARLTGRKLNYGDECYELQTRKQLTFRHKRRVGGVAGGFY